MCLIPNRIDTNQKRVSLDISTTVLVVCQVSYEINHISSSRKPCRVGGFIPILQERKPRLSEVRPCFTPVTPSKHG